MSKPLIIPKSSDFSVIDFKDCTSKEFELELHNYEIVNRGDKTYAVKITPRYDREYLLSQFEKHLSQKFTTEEYEEVVKKLHPHNTIEETNNVDPNIPIELNRSEMRIWEEVKEIIAQKCVPVNNIHLQASLQEDLALDSLDCVELIMEFESRFRISIDDNEVEHIHTVYDIVELIDKKK